MQVIQLTSDSVTKYEYSIKSLLRIGYMASFNAMPTPRYVDEKIAKLHCFLQDGSAIVLGIEEDDHKLAGYLWAFSHNTVHGLRLHVQHLAVMPQYQGQGMGKLLIEKLDEIAQGRNIREIELIVSSDNQSAVDFYTKREFAVERYIMTKRVKKRND